VAKGEQQRDKTSSNKTIKFRKGMNCHQIGMQWDEIRMTLISDAFGQRAMQGAAVIERDTMKV